MGQAGEHEPVRLVMGEAVAHVAELKQEHRALQLVYQEIDSAVSRDEWSAVVVLMELFRDGLEGHLSKENRKIYGYLRETSEQRKVLRELVSFFSEEMTSIERVLYVFVDCYINGVDEGKMNSFKRDFATAGELLNWRIQAEESLLYGEYLRHCDGLDEAE